MAFAIPSHAHRRVVDDCTCKHTWTRTDVRRHTSTDRHSDTESLRRTLEERDMEGGKRLRKMLKKTCQTGAREGVSKVMALSDFFWAGDLLSCLMPERHFDDHRSNVKTVCISPPTPSQLMPLGFPPSSLPPSNSAQEHCKPPQLHDGPLFRTCRSRSRRSVSSCKSPAGKMQQR